MKKLLVLIVVFLLVFHNKSEAKPLNFSFEVKFGNWDEKKEDCILGFGVCSIKISLKTFGFSSNETSQTMEVKGEIQNNMLVINFPKEIDENGRNKQGKYAFSIQRDMVIDQELAKGLGVEKLTIASGNYEIKQNRLELKIVSPRDPATGQSSGKRLLPTVNKKDIAIDESGVH
jgi:hypothetical protein